MTEIKHTRVKTHSMVALEILQRGAITYKELARQMFGDDNDQAVRATYQTLSKLRKQGHIYYPIFGEGTELKLPTEKSDAIRLLDYVSRRSRGVLKSYARTTQFIENKFSVGHEVDAQRHELTSYLNG